MQNDLLKGIHGDWGLGLPLSLHEFVNKAKIGLNLIKFDK